MIENNIKDLIVGKKPDFTKPVLFIDFDDVINIFDERRDDPYSSVELRPIVVSQVTPNPYGIPIEKDRKMVLAFEPEIVERLSRLNAVWITSWKQLSQSILNVELGLDFGYVDWYYRGLSDTGEYGKMTAINDVVSQYNIKKFAVVDDKFYHSNKLSLERANPNCNILVVTPLRDVGLTLEELDLIERFLSN